jgi:cytochrome P450
VFLGQEICRNPKWQRITIDYTVNAFMAVSAVKRYPQFLHRFVHWFLPQTRKLRSQVTEARRIIQPVIDQRTAAGWVHPGNESGKKYTDALQWMQDLSKGKEVDFAMGQLGLSLAAIHTTTDLLTQVIYNLCQHPDMIQPLRDEIAAVVGGEGWKRTALYKMKVMDSVIKESQRLKPPGLCMFKSKNGLSLSWTALKPG